MPQKPNNTKLQIPLLPHFRSSSNLHQEISPALNSPHTFSALQIHFLPHKLTPLPPLPGTRVANLCRALSMTVQISERPSHPPDLPPRPDRIPFPQLLSTSTVIFLTLPLNPSTYNLLTYSLLTLL